MREDKARWLEECEDVRFAGWLAMNRDQREETQLHEYSASYASRPNTSNIEAFLHVVETDE